MASEPLFALPRDAVEIVAFRWSSYDVPFWARPNTRAGRWNHLGDGPTQYWSLSPDASWAELIRHERLQTEAELDLVRMPFWVCRLSLRLVVDLTRAAERERLGIEEDDLIADDWRRCQDLGAALRGRALGVIAPCPALPGHANVTLFGARRSISWESSPALASAVPAAKVSIGRPPDGLVERVRRSMADPAADRLF